MSYGLRVYNYKGEENLTLVDRITRLSYTSSQTASAGNSGALSQISGKLTGIFSIPVNADPSKSAHMISRSGTTISWSTWSFSTFITPATCVNFCFSYT